MRSFIPCLLILCAAAPADDRPPRSTDPRIRIELFAEQPQVRTPTGIDVDDQGRVWVIESNTHFRPEGYDGHPGDRLLIMQDTDGDGRADDVKSFADGFTHTMSVAVRPAWMERVTIPGQESPAGSDAGHITQVFLATRREILLLEDTNGDDECDRRATLVHLETEGNYPHNGLAGFAFDALDRVYFGFGENLGADYTIIGSDGARFSGGGEGGNMYRMRPDGTELAHWATGFWNPHASCVDAFGRLFTVDNDPDSLPPCRLLHIVEGGDYGYRFRNGRKGQHPFTAWNGEIPGTLPMVAGTGEAPSGIVACEHGAFPVEYLGNLLVTSWGDHRIDRFVLDPHGASVESVAQPLIVGGENFRPVGIALAPDGSLYCSDWVLRDYNLHGRGRVWRISAANPADGGAEIPSIVERRLSARRMSQSVAGRQELLQQLRDEANPLRERIEALWALALVPPSEEQLDLLAFDEREQTILWHADEVSLAALELIDAPQMPFPNPRPDGLVPALTNQTPVSALVIAVRLARHYLKTDALAGVIYLIALESNDPFLQHTIRREMRRHGDLRAIAGQFDSENTGFDTSGNFRLSAFLISRDAFPEDRDIVLRGLRHPEIAIRECAVQWAAEERMTELRPDVAAILQSEPMNTSLFLSTLAALEMLDGKDPMDFDQTPAGQYVLPLLRNPDTPDAVKVQALRLVDANDPALEFHLLRDLLNDPNQTVQLEALRTLQLSASPQTLALLLPMLQDGAVSTELRDEAILAVAQQSIDSTAPRLLELLSVGNAELQIEVVRALRHAAGERPDVRNRLIELAAEALNIPGRFPDSAEMELGAALQLAIAGDSDDWPDLLKNWTSRPADDAAWFAALETAPDAADVDRGRRVFFHPNGPRCHVCHTVNGRGGNIGPDLSTIGRALSREKLIDSILEPGREVAPQFTAWNMLTTGGQVHTGMIVHENQGKTVLGTTDSELIELETLDIDLRTPLRASVMPDKLEKRMTVQEFRDLLAFLESLGDGS